MSVEFSCMHHAGPADTFAIPQSYTAGITYRLSCAAEQTQAQ